MECFNAITNTILNASSSTARPLNVNIACNGLQKRVYLRDNYPKPRYESSPPLTNVIPSLNIISFIKFYGIRVTFFVPDLESVNNLKSLITDIVTTFKKAPESSSFPKYLKISCQVQARRTHTPAYYGAWIGPKWDDCWRPDIGMSCINNEAAFMNIVTSASSPAASWKSMYESWDRYALASWNMHGL